MELALKLNYTKGIASAYSGLGYFYRQQGDYGKATEYQLYYLKYYEQLNKYSGITSAYNNLGVLYYRQGNWKEAMKSYHKSLYLARKEKQEVDITMVYLAMKNHVLAQQYAEKCLATALKNESKQWQKEAYLALSKIAEATHNLDKAHEYFKTYSALKDSIFNENSVQKIQQVQAIYETEKKQIEIDLLKKKQQVQQEQIKQQTLLLYLGGAIGVLIIIFAFVLYRNNLQKQRTNVLLEAQKKSIEIQNKSLEDKNNLILLKNSELEQ